MNASLTPFYYVLITKYHFNSVVGHFDLLFWLYILLKKKFICAHHTIGVWTLMFNALEVNVNLSYRDQLYAMWVDTSKSLPSKFLILKPKEFVSYMHKNDIIRERVTEK